MVRFQALQDIVDQEIVVETGFHYSEDDCFETTKGLMEVTGVGAYEAHSRISPHHFTLFYHRTQGHFSSTRRFSSQTHSAT